MNRVLITGGNGFVGGNLLRFFRSRQKQCWNHGRHSNLDQVLQDCQPDLIINCAAEIYDTDSMFDANVALVIKLLEWSRHNRCTMLHFGSSSEYGTYGHATSETDTLRPKDWYAGTKAAATLLCQGYARQHQLDVVTVRLYSPYGPGEKPHRLFPRLWQAFEKNRHMKLVEGVHDFLHIDDVIMAVDQILKNPYREPGEIINVCSGQQHTNSAVLALFEKYYGRTAPVEFDSSVVSTPMTWQGSNDVIKNKYHWQPDFDIEDGIYRFIQNAYYE